MFVCMYVRRYRCRGAALIIAYCFLSHLRSRCVSFSLLPLYLSVCLSARHVVRLSVYLSVRPALLPWLLRFS